MKFKIRVRDIGDKDDGRWEEFIKATDDADKCAKEMIERFNNTLFPNQPPREILEVVVIDATLRLHDWRKTNLVTIMARGGGSYDTCACSVCGITGKRHGMGGEPQRDKKYRKSKYEYCNPLGRDESGKNNAVPDTVSVDGDGEGDDDGEYEDW